MRLPLNVPVQQGLAPEISAAVRLNCYLEAGGDFSPLSLICRPGLRPGLDGEGSGTVRGRGYMFNGEFWFARGNKVYSTTGTTTTERGTLNTSTGYVDFADNGEGIGDQLLIVDGASGYIWDTSDDTFTEIADADFPASPVQVVYLNFFFIVFDRDTQKFYASDSLDGTAWQSLRFASAEAVPDDVVAISATRQDLILIGERSTEFWTYTGNVDFEFERFQNGVIASGCEAGFSVVTVDNGLLYLENTRDGGRRFVRPGGGVAALVSPNWLNVLLDRMTTVSDCFGYAFKYRGHEFAVFQFPSADETFVYDASTRQWARWTYFEDGKHKRFLVDAHAYLNGKHYGVDRRNGNIVQLEGDYDSDAGADIRMEWIAGHVQAEGRRVKHSAYQLQMAEGAQTLGGDLPYVMLQWSDDGGHTWSNEHWRSMGARGKYGHRIRWTRLGMARDRVYRHAITAPVKRIVTAQEIELAAA